MGILAVHSPWDGSLVGKVPAANPDDVHSATARALRAYRESPLTPQQRHQVLINAAGRVAAQREELARLMAEEAGKPVRSARGEVDRAVQTLTVSAEEAKRITGEVVPVSSAPGSEQRFAFALRRPIGPVCAITPFNFPLNLVAHKVGPAIAAGNTVVLKPAELTPLTAVRLAAILSECGLPSGHLELVHGGAEVGSALLAEPAFRLYNFTGSTEVGRHIQREAGLRRTLMELGANSANIVHRDADLGVAAEALAAGAFSYAGQSCISVQRIYVHRDVRGRFRELFLEAVGALVAGDPLDERTDLGPMISEAAATRAQAMVQDAVAAGAKLVASGPRDGALLAPQVLEHVKPEMDVCRREVFAPVASLIPYDDLGAVVAEVNAGSMGLNAGLFTESLSVVIQLARDLEVGGLIVNDTSAYRADLMPYGGVKESGAGREGPRYAIEAMTDLRLVVMNPLPGGTGETGTTPPHAG
ncbi:MAG: aldehyde dehydrogenase family protein [Candidatus Dormibacteria bacterium]